jgi:hypothetical protein
MKSHFKHEALWMMAYQFGPLLVGVVITIVVMAVRGAHHSRHATQGSASSARP